MADLPEIVRIPDTFDTVTQKIWVREQWERSYPQVNLIRLDRAKSPYHDLYRETVTKRWQPPLRLYAYVDPAPEKKTLTRYGVEDMKDLLVFFSTLHLSDLGVLENNNNFLVGDLVEFDGDKFEIVNHIRAKEGYWGNTNIPMMIVCNCLRYRMGS